MRSSPEPQAGSAPRCHCCGLLPGLGRYPAVCDPVMGDDGRLYCRPEMPAAFRGDILPIASVITPNQFEAELLSGVSISSEVEALRACEVLHSRGPHTVILTSLDLPGWRDSVTVLASTTLPQAAGSAAGLRLRVPRVHAYFTGTGVGFSGLHSGSAWPVASCADGAAAWLHACVPHTAACVCATNHKVSSRGAACHLTPPSAPLTGDLFTALLLGWTHKHPGNLKLALELAVAGLQAVLLDTVANCGAAASSPGRTAELCRARELRLIQNQRQLAQPVVQVHAEPI